ncbi:MAG TPA: bifunctional precorrin-2 dehydrogenase/sirohydrochlorin ferrochelatase [Anaerolineae bacterium]|nr:bifunctional precorrin-2 dehydrogenase/sirohydrochlorin ferrochelatase [Anaerolineae bacterium]
MNSSENKHHLFPVFLNINKKKCVVVGGGKVALRKVTDLLEAGAETTVVADYPSPEIEQLSRQGEIKLVRRKFKKEDIKDAFLVFAATDDSLANAEISSTARQYGIPVNAVDSPVHCDFFSGAVVKRGPMLIAISTSGYSPALAAGIRQEIEQLYPESFGEFIKTAGELRQHILSQNTISSDKKNEALKWLARRETFTIFLVSGKEKVYEEMKKIIFPS